MSYMFQETTSFNQDLNSWDVSSVDDMAFMFASATAFNGDVSSWDTGNVTNMRSMFNTATSFNQNIGSWDTSNVTNMDAMMYRTTAFDQNIGGWDVGSSANLSNFMGVKTAADYSTANLDAIYNGWIAYELTPSLSTTFGTIKYTAAGAEGKALLTRTNATVNVSSAANNGGLVRITTAAAHGLSTGNKVFIKDIVGTTEANGLWTVTVISATEIDLQGSTFTNAYTSGGSVRTGYGWTITDGGI